MMEAEVEESQPGGEVTNGIRCEAGKAIRAASMAPPGAWTLINSTTAIHIVRDFTVGILKVVHMADMMAPPLGMAAEITDIEASEVVDVGEISVIAIAEGGEAMVTIIRAVEVGVADALGLEDVEEVVVAENHVQTSMVLLLF